MFALHNNIMNKYCVYFRVSTKKQGQSGLGLAAQEEMVKPFVIQGELVGRFTEVESGGNCNRKELAKAIALCQKEGAILLVAKLDRLARNVLFISTLMESKVQFKCADMPEVDNFTVHLYAALAEKERKLISERTKAGLDSIKRIIERDGFYMAKSGHKITNLGNNKSFNNDKEKAEFYRNIVSRREYKKASDIGQDLAIALRQNGVPVAKIKEQLDSRGISLSIRTIYNYIR